MTIGGPFDALGPFAETPSLEKRCFVHCGSLCTCSAPSPSIIPDGYSGPITVRTSTVPSRTIIGLAGLAGSGKSTAALHLVERHGFERIRFAGPLKDMMRALGLTEAEIEGDRKEVPCGMLTRANFPVLLRNIDAAFQAIGVKPHQQYESHHVPLLDGWTYGYARDTFIEVLSWIVARGEAAGGATPRLAMQMVGTEWGRDRIRPDFWVRLWRHRVDALPSAVPVAADDCRFPNEAEAIRAAGGVLVRIVRPGAGTGAAGHSSEQQDIGAVVTTLHNDTTTDDLQHRVDALVRDVSWAVAGRHP